MKYLLPIALLIVFKSSAQTPITNNNFHQAIDTCLSTNPIDGLCYNCEFGAMPDWDVSSVTDMSSAFQYQNSFNADISPLTRTRLSVAVTSMHNPQASFFVDLELMTTFVYMLCVR